MVALKRSVRFASITEYSNIASPDVCAWINLMYVDVIECFSVQFSEIDTPEASIYLAHIYSVKLLLHWHSSFFQQYFIDRRPNVPNIYISLGCVAGFNYSFKVFSPVQPAFYGSWQCVCCLSAHSVKYMYQRLQFQRMYRAHTHTLLLAFNSGLCRSFLHLIVNLK